MCHSRLMSRISGGPRAGMGVTLSTPTLSRVRFVGGSPTRARRSGLTSLCRRNPYTWSTVGGKRIHERSCADQVLLVPGRRELSIVVARSNRLLLTNTHRRHHGRFSQISIGSVGACRRSLAQDDPSGSLRRSFAERHRSGKLRRDSP